MGDDAHPRERGEDDTGTFPPASFTPPPAPAGRDGRPPSGGGLFVPGSIPPGPVGPPTAPPTGPNTAPTDSRDPFPPPHPGPHPGFVPVPGFGSTSSSTATMGPATGMAASTAFAPPTGQVETTRSIALSAILTGWLAVLTTVIGLYLFILGSFTDQFTTEEWTRNGPRVKDLSTQMTMLGMLTLAAGVALIGVTTNALTRRSKGVVSRRRPPVPSRAHTLMVSGSAFIGVAVAYLGLSIFLIAAFTDEFVEYGGYLSNPYRRDLSGRSMMIGLGMMVLGGLILLMTVWAIRGRKVDAPDRVAELVPPGPFTWSGLVAIGFSILFTIIGFIGLFAGTMSSDDESLFGDGGDGEGIIVFILVLGVLGIIASTEALRGRTWARWTTASVLAGNIIVVLYRYSKATNDDGLAVLLLANLTIFGFAIAGQLAPRSDAHCRTVESYPGHP